MKLTNTQKIDLIINDLEQWSYGNESNDSLMFALKHNFRLHAASLWLGTGAMSESIESQVSGVKISRKAELKEINELISMADIYICNDCSHHSFFQLDSEPVTCCESCLSNNLKLDKREA